MDDVREGGPAGYEAAVEGVAVLLRGDRAAVRVSGRAPVQMLDGILTSTLPAAERPVEPGVRSGRAFYSTLLTPRGRVVSDLRVLRTDEAPQPGGEGSGDPASEDAAGGKGPASAGAMMRGPAMAPGPGGGEELLLDLPRTGLDGVLEHFGRFLPPRFARAEDVSDEWSTLTVAGPGAASLLSLHALGLRVDADVLDGLEEGEYRAVDTGAGSSVRVLRSGDLATPSWDLLADGPTVDGIRRTLLDAGAEEMAADTFEILRIEAGRPAYGVDVDAETIPVEAGLAERAIDHGKGCYTGQEVIVRIRDRGRVNRRLRGLRMSEGEPPEPGTILYAPEARGDRSAGTVTSVARSPRMGLVALAYVRREVAPGGIVRLGSDEGPEARVVELESAEWGPGAG